MLCYCSVESAASLLSMLMCEFFQVQGNPSPCFLKSSSVLKKVKKMLQNSNTKRLGRCDCCGLFVMHKSFKCGLHLFSPYFCAKFILVQRTQSSGVLKIILNKINKKVMDSDMFCKPNSKRLRGNGYCVLFVMQKAWKVVCISSLHVHVLNNASRFKGMHLCVL